MIVDSMNLAFRYKHRGDEEFAEDYLKTVKSLAKSYKAEKVIITTDFGSSTYRMALYPDYKGDRKAKIAEQTKDEAEAFERFFTEFNVALEYCAEEFPVLKMHGVEADDVAAYLVNIYKDWKDHIWLISSDKDWDLLICDNVSRFSYVTRKEYCIEDGETADHIPFSMALDVKVLQGGKDNVVGIPGVGPKRAIQLVEQYGSAFDVYDSVPLPGKQVFIQNVNKYADRILLNLQLMDKKTYCEEAIGGENMIKICKQLEDYIEL
jgi:5'-3' exonuclease